MQEKISHFTILSDYRWDEHAALLPKNPLKHGLLEAALFGGCSTMGQMWRPIKPSSSVQAHFLK